MVTAVEPDFDILEMGFDAYLSKPIRSEQLHDTVTNLLERSEYDSLLQEYYALVEKQAALRSAKTEEELERNEEYADLRERIEALSRELDAVMPELDDGDFVAMVRDIEAAADIEAGTDTEDTDRGERGEGGGADGA